MDHPLSTLNSRLGREAFATLAHWFKRSRFLQFWWFCFALSYSSLFILISVFWSILISRFIQKGKRISAVVLSSIHFPSSLRSRVQRYEKPPRRYSLRRQSEDRPEAKTLNASSSESKSSCQPLKQIV